MSGQAGPVGFAVIYRWRLREGTEAEFREAWSQLTEAIRKERGGLGSRLHRDEDGTWVAYAQWPDRDRWEQARRYKPADAEAFRRMGECVEESFPPQFLEPLEDLLVGGEA